MNRPTPGSLFRKAFAWIAMAALGLTVAMAQENAPQTTRSDGQIEMDVVHALDASKTLKNDLITAATIQGEVTLAGTVSSTASSELAESIVAHVPGVSKVHNTLKIGPSQDAQSFDDNQSADAQPETAAAATSEYPSPVPSQSDAQAAAEVVPPASPLPPQNYPAPPPAAAYVTTQTPLTIPAGTLLQIRTNESVSTKHAQEGTPVQFTVIRDVVVGGYLAIPRGATVHGVVTSVKKAGQLSGTPELSLQLTSLDLGTKSYDIVTDQFKVKGPNKAGRTFGHALGGAVIGALIGGAAGGGTGAAIGAGVGAGGGTVASAVSDPNAWIPAEALVDFHLQAPLTVLPVNQQEANRLATGLYPSGPVLYQRPPMPGESPYGPPGYYYAYPPVYYHPYYSTGEFYYWR